MPDITLLGHTFCPMDKIDHECFAGTSANALICSCVDGTILIYEPAEGTVSEITQEADGYSAQRDWTFKVIA